MMHDTWMDENGEMMTAEEIKAEKEFYVANYNNLKGSYVRGGYQLLMSEWSKTPTKITFKNQ